MEGAFQHVATEKLGVTVIVHLHFLVVIREKVPEYQPVAKCYRTVSIRELCWPEYGVPVKPFRVSCSRVSPFCLFFIKVQTLHPVLWPRGYLHLSGRFYYKFGTCEKFIQP